MDLLCSNLYRFGSCFNRTIQIKRYVPKGGNGTGHVLITSRVMLPGFDRSHSVRLECFSEQDSLKFLNIAYNDTGDLLTSSSTAASRRKKKAATDLAEALGHLPLALAIAGSYMRRCDLSFEEYVARLESSSSAMLFSERPHLMEYSMGLGASLVLSLEQVGDEGTDVLNALAFLGPEEITKELLEGLIRELLACPLVPPSDPSPPHVASNGHFRNETDDDASRPPLPAVTFRWALPLAVSIGAFLVGGTALLVRGSRSSAALFPVWWSALCVTAGSAAAVFATSAKFHFDSSAARPSESEVKPSESEVKTSESEVEPSESESPASSAACLHQQHAEGA